MTCHAHASITERNVADCSVEDIWFLQMLK